MQKESKLFSTQNLIKMAMMSVIAVILMQFGKITLPAIFPSFLEVDFSDVPAIVGIIAIHPLAGIVIVVLKNVLKALLFGTTSAYVGEIANLIVALGYVAPLTLLIRKKRTLKTITAGIVLGIAGIAVAGALINYFVVIPMYAKLFAPLDAIIGMGSAINPAITDKFTLVAYAIIPFNLFKGTVVAIISVLLVKAIQPVIRYVAFR